MSAKENTFDETRKSLLTTEESKQKQTMSTLIFIFGLLHKVGYIIIIVSCNDLSKYFKEEKLVTLYHASLVGFSFLAKLIHIKFLLRVVHRIKIIIVSAVSIIGCVSIVIAIQVFNFELSLFGVVLIGVSFAIADSIMQGFIKGIDYTLVGSYSSGSGWAGFLICIIYLFSSIFRVDLIAPFLVIIPLFIVNSMVFSKIIDTENKITAIDDNKAFKDELEHASINENLTISNFWFVFQKQFHYFFMFGIVLFVVFTIDGIFAITITKKYTHDLFFIQNGFVILTVVFKFACLISRSSLSYLKIERIHWPVMILCLFFVLFYNFAVGLFSTPAILCISIFIVGLIDGLCYVNIIYLVLKDENVPMKYKEISMNLNYLFLDIGFVLSSIFGLAFVKEI